jgi:hypothetical protein
MRILVNMSPLDRALRFFFGAVLVLISKPVLDVVPGAFLSYFCLIFGAVNMLSSIFGWCFMYRLVGIQTCPARKAP